MTPVTVTGTRPSDDFAPPATSLNRLGAPTCATSRSRSRHQQGADAVAGRHLAHRAVRNVPGLTIGAAEGGQIGNNINLNGFSARTDIYLDGMRDRGQYYRDTFALEQIEVLMGPSSMLFGRGSTGGVINQVTKKPSLTKATELQRLGHDQRPVPAARPTSTCRPAGHLRRSAPRHGPGRQGAITRDQTDLLDVGIAPSYKFGIGTPTEITL